MEEKKGSLLCVLEILSEYSDEDNILTCEQIIQYLRLKYHLDLDRRTIYKNIEMLNGYGYDISIHRENGKGYYLRDRLFEKSEVFLLCNAIYSSNFIPTNNTRELIDKILSTQSKYLRKEFNNNRYIDNHLKIENKQFFLNIEMINEAIKLKKSIKFNYMKYDKNKEMVKRRNELYEVYPYYMVYMNEKTYMVCKNVNYDNFSHYRLDRIKDIKITERNFQLPKSIEEPYEYAKNKIYMYGGNEIKITLKCDYKILDDILDFFGKSISIRNIDENYFETDVESSDQGMIYFALQYLNFIEVISPFELRNRIKEYIYSGLEKYK